MKMKTIRVKNNLIGASKGELEKAKANEDALAASLGRLAFSTPSKSPAKRKSRFWFKMEEQPIVVSPQEMKKKKPQYIDQQIISRLEIYKQTSPKAFQRNIVAVREFFLNEVAPKTIAAAGGAGQAEEVLRRLLDTDIDESTAQRFAMMVNRAATLKMGQFVADYFGLPKEEISQIIGLAQPGQGFDLRHVLDRVEEINKQVKKLK